MCYESKDFKEAIDLINEGFDLHDFVTQEMNGIEDTQKGLDTLSQKKENVIKVLIKIS